MARKQEKLMGDVTTRGRELALPLRGKLIPSRCCASIKVDFSALSCLLLQRLSSLRLQVMFTLVCNVARP